MCSGFVCMFLACSTLVIIDHLINVSIDPYLAVMPLFYSVWHPLDSMWPVFGCWITNIVHQGLDQSHQRVYRRVINCDRKCLIAAGSDDLKLIQAILNRPRLYLLSRIEHYFDHIPRDNSIKSFKIKLD